MLKFFLSLFLLLEIIDKSFGSNSANETWIRSLLLSGYDKYSIPSEPITIELAVLLRQIVGLDERSQILTTSSFLIVNWYDPRLKLENASKRDYLTVRANQIWQPDLYVINTADSNGFISTTDANLVYVELSSGQVIANFGLIGN